MIRVRRRPRGITLTEILISILIMGVGMTALLTLFPLGLIRIRDANRFSRSALLVESATADLGARNLLSKASFHNPLSGPWYSLAAFTPWPYDPWVQDTPSYGADPIAASPFGAYRGDGEFNINNASPHNKPTPTGHIPGPGLPVAYDPLWRMTTPPPPAALGTFPPVGYFMGAPSEARFASGIGFVRPDPNPAVAANTDPSAHGLQRITNFPYLNIYPNANATTVPAIFVSPEDMVLQSNTDSSKGVGNISPIVPDMTTGPVNAVTGMLSPQYDWNYTWMFTGQRSDATSDAMFVGDIVIFEKRPFAVDTATVVPYSTVNPGTVSWTVAGEPVVEAIFGYTNNVTSPGGTVGYGSTANRAVLLRWPASMPDPEVKVGGWIADVTYERNAIEDGGRSFTDPNTKGAGAFYPYQRCYWYQVAKRTMPAPVLPANALVGDSPATKGGMREMTVWTSTPLRAFTLLNVADGSPYHVNAALVSPYVVNVFPRTIYTR